MEIAQQEFENIVNQHGPSIINKFKKTKSNNFSIMFRYPDHPLEYMMELSAQPSSACKHAIRGILIVTLPKSGSVYISSRLCEALNVPKKSISSNTFPDDYLDVEDVKEFSFFGGVCQNHIPASPFNIQILAYYLKKVVVHVRDPRQSLVSWVHFINQSYRLVGTRYLLGLQLQFHRDYFLWDFEQQLDWCLREHFPAWVKWISDWVACAESKDCELDVLLCEFKDFKENPQQYFERIYEYFGISTESCPINLLKPEVGKDHFRKGTGDEFLTIFTERQLQETAKQIPKKLMQKFNWVNV